MWEGPANPVERADFEEDLIASTNENLYQKPLEFAKPHKAFLADHDNFFQSPLFDQELERSHQAFQMRLIERSDQQDVLMFAPGDDDFELDLEMNDLLGEFSTPDDDPLNPRFELDIFAAEDADSFCSGQSGCQCTTTNVV